MKCSARTYALCNDSASRYPFAAMATLRREHCSLGRAWDELSNQEQGLLRFAICFINRPRPSAKDLGQSHDHGTVREVAPRLRGIRQFEPFYHHDALTAFFEDSFAKR